MKCDRCKRVFPTVCAEREAPGVIVVRETLGGPVIAHIRYGTQKAEAVCVSCGAANAPRVKDHDDAGRWASAKARDAGLDDGKILDALPRDARAHGVERALLRAVADVLHDARPVGNARTEADWKRLSSAHATARRLAEISAAPR